MQNPGFHQMLVVLSPNFVDLTFFDASLLLFSFCCLTTLDSEPGFLVCGLSLRTIDRCTQEYNLFELYWFLYDLAICIECEVNVLLFLFRADGC